MTKFIPDPWRQKLPSIQCKQSGCTHAAATLFVSQSMKSKRRRGPNWKLAKALPKDVQKEQAVGCEITALLVNSAFLCFESFQFK